MKHKNKNLELLLQVFYADSYSDQSLYSESDLAMFKKMQIDLGISEIPNNVSNFMAYFIEQMYETDNSKVLINLLFAGAEEDFYHFDNNIGLVESEFEKGDWSDDGEYHKAMELEYGKEGYNIYHIHTKNYRHDFREMTPHSEGIEYYGSVLLS